MHSYLRMSDSSTPVTSNISTEPQRQHSTASILTVLTSNLSVLSSSPDGIRLQCLSGLISNVSKGQRALELILLLHCVFENKIRRLKRITRSDYRRHESSQPASKNEKPTRREFTLVRGRGFQPQFTSNQFEGSANPAVGWIRTPRSTCTGLDKCRTFLGGPVFCRSI